MASGRSAMLLTTRSRPDVSGKVSAGDGDGTSEAIVGTRVCSSRFSLADSCGDKRDKCNVGARMLRLALMSDDNNACVSPNAFFRPHDVSLKPLPLVKGGAVSPSAGEDQLSPLSCDSTGLFTRSSLTSFTCSFSDTPVELQSHILSSEDRSMYFPQTPTPVATPTAAARLSLSFVNFDHDVARRPSGDFDDVAFKTPSQKEKPDDRHASFAFSEKGRLRKADSSSCPTDSTELPTPATPPNQPIRRRLGFYQPPEPNRTPESGNSADSSEGSPQGRLHEKETESVQIDEASVTRVFDKIVEEIRTWDVRSFEPCNAVSKRLLDDIRSGTVCGMLMVHAPTEELRKLDDYWQFSDGGYLQDRLDEEHAYRVFHSKFRTIFREFLEHSQSDRWPLDHPHEAARGAPKDGGFAISATGVVRLAAAKFLNLPSADAAWKNKGTRHTTAFSLARFLKSAVVYVGSDAGTLHVITAASARNCKAFRVALPVS